MVVAVFGVAGLLLLASEEARAASACTPAAPALAGDVAAGQATTYPTFCSVPPTPNDVRSADGFREAVVTLRLTGRALVARTAPETYHLTGTDAFDERLRREAMPPPPIPVPGEANTDAFAADARAQATPPSPPR